MGGNCRIGQKNLDIFARTLGQELRVVIMLRRYFGKGKNRQTLLKRLGVELLYQSPCAVILTDRL